MHVCVFDPSQVSLRGEVSSRIDGQIDYYQQIEGQQARPIGSAFGRLELGIEVPLSRCFLLRYGVEHTSAISYGDRGQERAFVGFEWRPFK